MNAEGFDALSRACGRGVSRRRVLAGLLGLAATAVATRAGRAQSAGCTGDADCGPNQTCFNAMCQQQCTTTGPCQADSDCCGPGQTCVGGACQDPGAAPAGCQGDADCAAGETCINGGCQTASAPAAGCQSDADCGPNQTCFNAVCQQQCTTAGPCQTDADCCGPGQTCVSGTCQNPGQSGGSPAGVQGTSYRSPTYGYRLAWDGTWQVQAASSQGGEDVLRLTNGVSDVDIHGYAGDGGDARRCVQHTHDALARTAGVSDLSVATDQQGQPMAGGNAGAAFAVYNLTYAGSSGSPAQDSVFVACQALGRGALLAVDQVVRADRYNDQIPARRALLASVALPNGTSASPRPTPA